jgi:regulator of sirC expression with transglutaminase-like and TPR domain
MTALARFAELVGDEGAPVALDEATLLIAQAFNPKVDLGAGLWLLDDLAATCATSTFEGVLDHLVRVEGFHGNQDDYHDPLNSLLDAVLTRRTGIPITLSVVVIEVARRLGVGVVGIGMPGHFLIRSSDRREVFADPYHGALILEPAACRVVFQAMTNGASPWSDSFLQPVSSRAMVIRILNNLKALHRQRKDPASLRITMRLRAAFPEIEPVERPQLARLMAPFN